MKSKVIIALIIVFNFILSVPSNVYADTSSDSKGRITVDVSSDSDTLVKEGVKVGVVYVAKADGELLNVFGDVGSGMVDVTNSELAVKLYTYIKETGYDVNIKETDSFGKAEFDGLELGVYLVFDTEADLREKTFNPFLVSIPEKINGEEILSVKASPKIARPSETDGTNKTSTKVTVKTNTSKKLIQTGQLKWIVPVLAIAGLICILVGCLIGGTERKRKDAD